MAEKNYFEVLNGIDVGSKIEKKNGLSYLSWAWAWAELKKKFPDATYTVYENANGWCYFTDGKTCWVKTGVTCNGIEHIEYLPVMDYKNKSIPLDIVTSFDINKAIQRSLTKAVARHGLGLYIYAGEDLPEEATETASQATAKPAKVNSKPKAAEPTQAKPQTQAAAPAQAPRSPARQKLADFCNQNNLTKEEQHRIVSECGLNKTSTEEDYERAYLVAVSIKMEKEKAAEPAGQLPFEV